MATLKNFEELDAWKNARNFTKKIYDNSNRTPFSKDFTLCNQIQKASISIMSNIAEGFERSGNKGLFLPQVWEHFDTKEEFLGELCAQKARISRDAYKQPGTNLSVFTVFAFEEEHSADATD